MFRSAPSRETHQPTPEKMENNGSSKSDDAAASNDGGDIEVYMPLKQNCI
jgi:hypothetical protein